MIRAVMKKLVLAATALAVLGAGGLAEAQSKGDKKTSAACTVIEIRATKDGKDKRMDARLEKDAKLKKLLGRSPFDGFSTFKVLGDHSVSVEKNKTAEVKLNPGILTLRLRDLLPRLRFELDLEGVVSTEVKFDGGQYAPLVAAPTKDSAWIMALTCR